MLWQSLTVFDACKSSNGFLINNASYYMRNFLDLELFIKILLS